jgi:hypothetical protein
MKKLIWLSSLALLYACASLHSPYDLREWCHQIGSSRPTSVGLGASDPISCEREFEEDLTDPTPRILYVPRDIVMIPVHAARFVWAIIGRTEPPF